MATALGACSGSGAPVGPDGVEITVAPLNLPGIDYACYDLEVRNDQGDLVWSQGTATAEGAAPSLCSNQYGNAGGGDISYVGPCDASDANAADAGTAINRVTLRLDGLYDASDNDIGEYINPCPWPTGCTLAFECVENADVLVAFDLTIMREANQGFFDIAVNFEDVFCSAKFDTCYDVGGGDERPIELLFDGTGERGWTGVFGLACTPGSDATNTNLMYGPIVVDCGAAGVFEIDPSAGPGNQTATDGDASLSYGVYYGTEQLDCGGGAGSCAKRYWNLALSLSDLELLGATCTLSFSATANDDNEGFSAGLPTAIGQAYPYIDVATTLTTDGVAACQANPLNGEGSNVTTVYHGNITGLAAPVAMCDQFDGTVSPTGADCDGAAEPPLSGNFVLSTVTEYNAAVLFLDRIQKVECAPDMFGGGRVDCRFLLDELEEHYYTDLKYGYDTPNFNTVEGCFGGYANAVGYNYKDVNWQGFNTAAFECHTNAMQALGQLTFTPAEKELLHAWALAGGRYTASSTATLLDL